MPDRAMYRYNIRREDGWWTIRVPELGLTSQSQILGDTDRMATSIISFHLGTPPGSFAVTRCQPVPGTESQPGPGAVQ